MLFVRRACRSADCRGEVSGDSDSVAEPAEGTVSAHVVQPSQPRLQNRGHSAGQPVPLSGMVSNV